MAHVSKSALVAYTPAEMYALVDDIERYPEFLPWCGSTHIHERGDDQVRASIDIRYGALQRSFTTQNRMQPGKMIEVKLVEGPFRRLEGFWRFEPLGESACKVVFDLEFDFAGALVSMTLGPVFSQIANTMVDGFAKRAIEVYGKRTV